MKHLIGVRYSRVLMLVLALIPGVLIGALLVLSQVGLEDETNHRGFRTHRAQPLPARSKKLHMGSAVQTDGGEFDTVGGSNTQALSVPVPLPVFSSDPLDGLELLKEKKETMKPLRLHEVTTEVLSWTPRIFMLHNLLTDEECEQVMTMSRPSLEASSVVDASTGQGIYSSVRTSQGTFLTDDMDPVLQRITDRVSHIVMLPGENQEAMQVLRYQIGQYYRPHEDFFADELNKNRGGQRTMTVLMYLQSPEEGGETIFPLAGDGSMCKCGNEMQKGLCVKPRRGSAVLFMSLTPSGGEDGKSLHGSCDVIKGEKWSATKWIRTGKFV